MIGKWWERYGNMGCCMGKMIVKPSGFHIQLLKMAMENSWFTHSKWWFFNHGKLWTLTRGQWRWKRVGFMVDWMMDVDLLSCGSHGGLISGGFWFHSESFLCVILGIGNRRDTIYRWDWDVTSSYLGRDVCYANMFFFAKTSNISWLWICLHMEKFLKMVIFNEDHHENPIVINPL